MRIPFRPLALVTAVVLTLSLGAISPGPVPSASAVSDSSAEPTAADAVVTLSGIVRAVPRESTPMTSVIDEHGAVTSDHDGEPPASDGLDYSLLTDTGMSVPLTGVPAGAVTGDRVEAELTVPDELLERLSPEGAGPAPDAPESDGRPSPGAEHASALDTPPLEVSGWTTLSSPSSPAAAARSSDHKPHVLNVAIMTQPGEDSSALFPDAVVDRIVSNLGTFWVQQSGGQISSLTSDAGYQRFTQTGCSAYAAWAEAAAAFDSTESFYNDPGNPVATHLVVLASEACRAGSGLGTIGWNIDYGGEMWAVVAPGRLESQVVAHEFGHNISLGHSNLISCPDAPTVIETDPPCRDVVYGDHYDVMARGNTLTSGDGTVLASTEALAALNVTHRVHLGVLENGAGLQTVSFPDALGSRTVTATLAPASAASGTRGIAVDDPKTGATYYLEYRSGTGTSTATGRDAAAFYRTVSDYDPSYGIGVRVLRLRGYGAEESSAALRTTGPNDTERPRFLAAGDSLSTDLGGMTVSVLALSGSAATVTITLSGTDVSGVTTRDRLSGADRYGTAIAVSKAAFPDGAPVVYLATGTTYPDALAAGPAASAQRGPLLLTTPGELPAEVRTELKRLAPARIVIVGGVDSVSPAVAAAVKTIAPVTRLAGPDRYATGRAIVAYAFPTAPAVLVATGADFPDALSAGAAGAASTAPVVLVNGAAGLDPLTGSLLTKLGTTRATITGGPDSVSWGIQSELGALPGMTLVDRLAGDDRYATSSAVNAAYFGTPTPRVLLASGSGFADALTGGPAAARFGAPLYVVPPSCVREDVLAALDDRSTEHVTLVGGTASLSAAVQELKGC